MRFKFLDSAVHKIVSGAASGHSQDALLPALSTTKDFTVGPRRPGSRNPEAIVAKLLQLNARPPSKSEDHLARPQFRPCRSPRGGRRTWRAALRRRGGGERGATAQGPLKKSGVQIATSAADKWSQLSRPSRRGSVGARSDLRCGSRSVSPSRRSVSPSEHRGPDRRTRGVRISARRRRCVPATYSTRKEKRKKEQEEKREKEKGKKKGRRKKVFAQGLLISLPHL